MELLNSSAVVGLRHDDFKINYAVAWNSFFLVHYLHIRYYLHYYIPLQYFYYWCLHHYWLPLCGDHTHLNLCSHILFKKHQYCIYFIFHSSTISVGITFRTRTFRLASLKGVLGSSLVLDTSFWVFLPCWY